MGKIFLFLVMLILQTGCSQENKGKMPISDFKPELLDNAILVDVRTPEEFSEGHLENADNIDWYDPAFSERFKTVDKNKTIYLYCKMGGRSAKAQEKLKSMGFINVIDLEGGYDAVKVVK